MKYQNRCSDGPESTVDLFGEFFKAIYPDTTVREARSETNEDSLELSHDIIREGLLKLDSNKSAGPDKLSNVYLKGFEAELIEPLHMLFNSSLSAGYFPSLWRVSRITPIHKKGSRSCVENYRGIAIQSAIPKLFESMVYEHLYAKIEDQISPVQHGFLKRKSVVTNLCEFCSLVNDYISKGYQVDCIYTDMSKAFDTVEIDSILKSLTDFGIRGSLFNWIKTYLESRTQFVQIRSNVSGTFTINSGVPQGSHIGPLLFVMVMNKLPNFMTNAFIIVYADDVKIFLPIKKSEDCRILQNDITNFGRFCIETGLSVNPSKCSVMTFTRKTQPVTHDYVYQHLALTRVETIRDLGVTLDRSLTYNAHLDRIIRECLQMFALVRRFGRELDDPHAILAIYIGLVRSKLDFASVIWRPQYATHITRLENVQKKFVRFALRNLPWTAEQLPTYQELCGLVNLDTMYSRHRISDVVFFSNIMAGRIRSQPLYERLTLNTSPVQLRRQRTFALPFRSRNYTQHEATNSTICST